MRKVDLPKFRQEVVTIINANKQKVTSFEYEEDFSVFTFCGEYYACEINLSDKWFGYNLYIEASEGNIGCHYEASNDGIYSEKVLMKIYDEMVELVKAIFDERVIYLSTLHDSYVVVENSAGKYSVVYNEKKKRFWITYASGWYKDQIEKSEFDKLNIKSLKVLS